MYVENEPIANIDLWGLQKAKNPFFKAGAQAAIKAGESGFEMNLFGSKTGVTAKHGSSNFLSISADYDNVNGADLGGSLFFSDKKETYGLSGGDIFGGEFSATINPETGESTITTSTSLGLFYLKNEIAKDSEGKIESTQSIGIEFGLNAGIILGIDISGFLEFDISKSDAPEGLKTSDLKTEMVQDNTRIVIPIEIEE